MDNTYWQNSGGMVTVSDSETVNRSLESLGWKRITRAQYRKHIRAQGRGRALDVRAMGENADEAEDE